MRRNVHIDELVGLVVEQLCEHPGTPVPARAWIAAMLGDRKKKSCDTPVMDRGVTPRVHRFLQAEFGQDADLVASVLEEVHSGNQDRERVVAAVVFAARGSLNDLDSQITLSRLDWRDALVNGELDGAGWTSELDRRLGPP